ncbi:hypothetical protein NE236_08940 [Actinoallomurus purpureus]|uniref:hypothetical protein n=1 Tax=Actinoallomurus purpureus TaxID=478114 RepID=UPI002092EA3A|nr:hypothetical protein [Actinoallomurus purpureus]MCO6005108.1 hypothetical protein [Actinoallomurus purpureus]
MHRERSRDPAWPGAVRPTARADAHAVGYLGWTWNTWGCGSGPSLISSYDGAATAYGAGLRDHLRSTS